MALSNAVAGEASSLSLNLTLTTALEGGDVSHGPSGGGRIAIALPDGFSIATALPQFELEGGGAWDVELPAPQVISLITPVIMSQLI